MKKIKFSLLIIIFINIFISSSCINIERKYKINTDGSGTAKETIDVDRSFYTMMNVFISAFDTTKSMNILDTLYNHPKILEGIKENLESNGLKTLNLYGVTNADSSSTYIFEYQFDKIEKMGLSVNLSPDMNQNNSSLADVKWIDNGNKVNFSFKQKPSNEQENNSLEGMDELTKNKTVSIEIEFPYNIGKSNATESLGNTAKWVYDFKDFQNKDFELNLEAELIK